MGLLVLGSRPPLGGGGSGTGTGPWEGEGRGGEVVVEEEGA